MNWTALLAAGLTVLGSIFGSYLAVREMLVRIDERLKSQNERLDRHSNRLNRMEDHYFSK